VSRGLFANTKNEFSFLKRLGLAEIDFLTPENFSEYEDNIDQLIDETERKLNRLDDEGSTIKRIERELDETMKN